MAGVQPCNVGYRRGGGMVASDWVLAADNVLLDILTVIVGIAVVASFVAVFIKREP